MAVGGTVIDRAVLDRLAVDLGHENARKVCRIWIADAPRKLLAMRAGIEAGDALEVARPAHSLKSASALVGATISSELCAEIEQHARDNKLDLAERRLHELSAEVSTASGDLEAYLSEAPP